MKRDMDVIRQIVLAARDAEGPLDRIPGMEETVFADHVLLLDEAGLVKAAVREFDGRALAAILFRLTWTGHEFADSINDDTLWRKAKDMVIKPAGSWTFGILAEVVKTEITRRLGGEPQ